jgi:hypothetical protein
VHCSVLYYDSVLHIFTPDMELWYSTRLSGTVDRFFDLGSQISFPNVSG